MVAFGYSCDRWSVAQRLAQPCGQTAAGPGEGTPENAAFGRAGLYADLPCDLEARREFGPTCIQA